MPYNNMTNNYQSSRYIVDADGTTPFSTIQSAIDQVVLDALGLPVTIEIRPGTYTENLVLVTDINLTGCSEAIGTGTTAIYQVIIDGIHTPPAAGQIAFSNIKFASTTDIIADAGANTCNIGFYNCIFACDAGYICNMALATGDITIDSCSDISTNNGIVFNTGAASVDIINSKIGASVNVCTLSGPTRIFNSRIFCPTEFVLTAAAQIQDSTIDTALTVSNDADVSIYNSYMTNTLTCLTTTSTVAVKLGNVVFDTPVAGSAIDGTGSINAGELVFMQTSAIAGTITITGSDVCASSLLRTYGNIDVPATNAAGTEGVVYLDSTPYIQALGTNNTFIGEEAGNLTLTVANATDETACGYQALHDLTTGQYNTAVGSSSLAVTTGSNNVALGYQAGSALVAAESSNIMLGSVGIIGDSNTIRIGDDGVGVGQQDKTYIAGIYQATSGATKEIVYIDSNFKLSSSNLGITQWTTATADLTAAVNTGYVVKNAVPGNLLTITLPAASVVGDVIEITGYTAGMWSIAQQAGQVIHWSGIDSTVGVGGSVSATTQYDSIKLVCVTDNLEWNVLSAPTVLIIV